MRNGGLQPKEGSFKAQVRVAGWVINDGLLNSSPPGLRLTII